MRHILPLDRQHTGQSRVIYRWIVGIDHWSRVSRHWIADINHGTQSPNTWLTILVVEVESLTIKLLSPVTGAKSLATTAITGFWSEVPNHQTASIGRWSDVSSHQTSDLVTKWGRGSQRVFGKYFTKFSKVKHFTTFYKGFYGQRKIFYEFDYILPRNTWNRKIFSKNILLQNKQSEIEILWTIFDSIDVEN